MTKPEQPERDGRLACQRKRGRVIQAARIDVGMAQTPTIVRERDADLGGVPLVENVRTSVVAGIYLLSEVGQSLSRYNIFCTPGCRAATDEETLETFGTYESALAGEPHATRAFVAVTHPFDYTEKAHEMWWRTRACVS